MQISIEWALFKWNALEVYSIAIGRVYNISQHATCIIVNNQVKGKILVKRINVWIEPIKHSENETSS